MNSPEIRFRFAPSPTGGLHIGGVRTALYAYLLAKKYGGKFILRIEDTDRARYAQGAEAYIVDALAWCGITFDEGPHIGGAYGPYRQSERKHLYQQYARELVEKGYAYYAFDTEEELEKMKARGERYDYAARMRMKNSLSLSTQETEEALRHSAYVTRFKNEAGKRIVVPDEIRGEVVFDSNLQDDKILLKSDGMPTYHLAVVVDDYLMNISHVFRGEEWLPSAPIHVALWEAFGWTSAMPKWTHLPLLLKPEGHGKLSKRETQRLGIPIFPMEWKDAQSGETYKGYKEEGFLPSGFINMLALFGWSFGGEREIFSMEELVDAFSIEGIHRTGARFDYDKALWINSQHLKRLSKEELLPLVKSVLSQRVSASIADDTIMDFIALIRDRCATLNDFWINGHFLFIRPQTYNTEGIKQKWDQETKRFFLALAERWRETPIENAAQAEAIFHETAETLGVKANKQMLALRIILVGDKFGPHLFDIVRFLGGKEASDRIVSFVEKEG